MRFTSCGLGSAWRDMACVQIERVRAFPARLHAQPFQKGKHGEYIFNLGRVVQNHLPFDEKCACH
jgi:hypothetical protein